MGPPKVRKMSPGLPRVGWFGSMFSSRVLLCLSLPAPPRGWALGTASWASVRSGFRLGGDSCTEGTPAGNWEDGETGGFIPLAPFWVTGRQWVCSSIEGHSSCWWPPVFTQSHSSLWVLATTPSPCLVSSKGSNSSQTLRVSGPHHPFLVFSHPTHNCINSLFINLSSVTPISVYKHPDDITYYP